MEFESGERTDTEELLEAKRCMKAWGAKPLTVKKPSALRGLDETVYHNSVFSESGDKVVSKSDISKILRSPAHYIQMLRNRAERKDPTSAQKDGSERHKWMLEYSVASQDFGEMLKRMVVKPDFSGKGAKAAREEWEAGLEEDKIVVTSKQYDDFVANASEKMDMVQKLMDRPDIHDLFSCEESVSEMSIFRRHRGVWIKCRPDFLGFKQGRLRYVELKFTASVYPRKFLRIAEDFDYDLQCYLYKESIESIIGSPCEVVILAVERESPYAHWVYEMSDEWLESGRRKFNRGIDQLIACRRNGDWPITEATGRSTIKPLSSFYS